jgi:serine/threonine protein kinase
MALSPGTKLGPYEILEAIGAGGMGEVYRGRDPRFERDVAIKVLPANFSDDQDRLMRFQQEAKATGALNHPNILSVYDTGSHDGAPYLVAELLEGDTLRAKLQGGKLSQRKAIDHALQIARGLSAAHEKGIVHRDLKPENVFVTKDGRVKILDFGLAKLTNPEPPKSKVTQLPTTPGTEPGMVLGTVGYMSPEQVRGKGADPRSDIFAFGAILYEMLTGARAFHGDSPADTMSAILHKDPPELTAGDLNVSPALARIVNHCVEKDPEQRFHSASDIAFNLETLSVQSESTSKAASLQPSVRIPLLVWKIISIVGVATALLLGYAYLKAVRKPQEVIRSSILLPEKWYYQGWGMALSPNGKRLAFVAGSEGKGVLWIRALEKTDAEEVPGTESAAFPFWSPDSRFVGFFQSGKMKKIDPSGGPATVICDAPAGRGGTWNGSGIILFAPEVYSALYQVPAAGGTASAVTRPAGPDLSHRWPSFLPDGRHFLYLVQNGEQTGIFVGSLDSTETKRVASDLSNAAYATPGYLLFVRGNTLMGQSFDPDRQILKGEPFRITQQKIGSDSTTSAFSYTVADGGILAYRTSSILWTQMHWYDLSGRPVGQIGEPGYYVLMDIARDSNKVLVERLDPETQEGDLWVFDLARDSAYRVTFQPGNYFGAVFSFDGQRIVYGREDSLSLGRDIFVKSSSGTDAEKSLVHSDGWKMPNGWSPDGRFILYQSTTKKGNAELWLLPLTGDQKPRPFLQTPFNTYSGAFSPDGKWIAYASDESGRSEVYVKAVTGPGRWQVSTNGGFGPGWLNDGKELTYGSIDNKFAMAVDIKAGLDLAFGTPHQIVELPQNVPCLATFDGQRFLCADPVTGESGPISTPISLVVNWQAGLH